MKSIGVLLLGVVLAAAVPNAAGVDCYTGVGPASAAKQCPDGCGSLFELPTSPGPPVVQSRGCKSDIDADVVARPQQFGLFCTKDRCNVDVLELEKCIVCDTTDTKCTTSPETTTAPLSVNAYLCYTTKLQDEHGNTLNSRNAIKDATGLDDFKRDNPVDTYKMCNGDNCNKDTFPEDRSDCGGHVCLKEVDTCQAMYSDIGGVLTSRACFLENKDACAAVGRACKDCTGPCDPIIDPLECYKCLETDWDCVRKPTAVKGTCVKISDQCVTKNIAGKNFRGCIPLANATTCTDADCTTCATHKCNEDVFPVNRLQCHTCTASTGKLCDVVGSLDPVICLDTADECFTKVEGSKVARGCYKEAASPTCAAGTCEKCSKISCSKTAVKDTASKCYQCTEADKGCGYILDPSIQPQLCTGKELPRNEIKCYEYKSTNIKRGCENNLIGDEQCADGTLCNLCSGEGCNKAEIKNAVKCHTCLGCNTISDEKQLKECATSGDECYTKITVDGVNRGCAAFGPVCDEISCRKCTGSGCNTLSVKDATRKCYQCTKDDKGCDFEIDKTLIEPATCPGKVFEGFEPDCYNYIKYDVRRGCATDAETKECADGTECRLCNDKDGCNDVEVKNPFRCHKCVGAGCDDVTASSDFEECEGATCITEISDGVVSRGCGADAPVCEGLSCLKCDASKCNNLAVKETDIKCYQCKAGVPGCDYELGTTLEPTQCKGKFIEGSKPQCYQYIEDDVRRGCETDAEKACADGTLCKLCDEDGCNNLNVKNNFKCHTCTGDSCVDVTNGKMKKCAATEATCFTTVVGTNVTRGCAAKVETEVKTCTSVSCTCLESECNNVNVVNGTRTCYKCDKGNAACGGRVDEAILKPELCLQKVIGEIEPKCYEFVKDDVKRGCANTLNVEDSAVCEAADKCKLCDSNGCNNNENSSVTASGAMFLIIAAVVTSLFAY